MKTTSGALALAGIAILAAGFAAPANAQCVRLPTASLYEQQSSPGGPHAPTFSLAAYDEPAPVADQDPIVGMWKIKMVSKGTAGTPDGTVIDVGYSQWHSDGTEIINSSRAPSTSSFCLGVWEKTGASTYRLNHFMISWNPDGTLQGPGNLHETVTLSANHQSFTGTFTIDQYDKGGRRQAHVTGTVTGTRITVNTPMTGALLN
jgi:hypothetical protein